MIHFNTYHDYKRKIAAYEKWAKQFVKPNGWTVIPADAIAPVKVTNAMRSSVEIYELNHNQPDVFFAYVGKGNLDGAGCDRVVAQSYNVTTWTGEKICAATKGASWHVRSHMGDVMSQFYARFNERAYTGRSFGSGMYIRLKETAESKRLRGARV